MTTQINCRVEDDIKAKAEKALKEMGLTMSTAINMFLVKVAREQRIPFEVAVNDPFYDDDNMALLRASATQMERTGGTIHEIGMVFNDD